MKARAICLKTALMPLMQLKELASDRSDEGVNLESDRRIIGGIDHCRMRSINGLNFRSILSFLPSITAPQNPECELARVSETEEIVIHQALVDAFDIQVDYIYGEATRKHEEKILSAIYQYRKGEHFKSMKGKNILLIDEGSETGLKLMCAIKTAFAQKAKAVYVAAPIMPTSVVEALDPIVDGVFCLQEIDDYIDTGYYYQNLRR
jgi:putative phosphoribosyl transferase